MKNMRVSLMLVVILVILTASVGFALQPLLIPQPFWLKAKLKVDGELLPTTTVGDPTYSMYTIKVTNTSGVEFTPVYSQGDAYQEEVVGRFSYKIPKFDATDQTGGAQTNQKACIWVYKGAQKLNVTYPAQGSCPAGTGEITIGADGEAIGFGGITGTPNDANHTFAEPITVTVPKAALNFTADSQAVPNDNISFGNVKNVPQGTKQTKVITLGFANTGDDNTTLEVDNFTISGPDNQSFVLNSTDNISVAKGSTNTSRTITFTPNKLGAHNAILSFFTNTGPMGNRVQKVVALYGVGVVDNASTIAKSAGDNQFAQVTQQLAQQVVVVVTDQYGNRIAGVPVQFAATGATVNPTNVQTDASGLAATTVTLGTTAGQVTITATSAGLAGSPVTFTATALPGSATKLAVTSQYAQISCNNPPQPTTITAYIQDAHGNTVTTDNITQVRFTVSNATYGGFGNNLDGMIIVTPTNGVATTTFKGKTDQCSQNNPQLTITADTTTGSLTAATTQVRTVPFSLSKQTVNLVVGQSYTFTAVGGTAQTTWALSSQPKGTLNRTTGDNATYTATTVGTDNITITEPSLGNITATGTVTVYTPVTVNITTPKAITKGQQLQIVAGGGNGQYIYTIVEANPVGVATINGNTVTAGNQTGSFKVMVKDNLTYRDTDNNSATTATIHVYDNITIGVTTVYRDTSTNKIWSVGATGGSGEYTYTSDNASVATVSDNGTITAVAKGTTTIRIRDKNYPNDLNTALITIHVNTPIAITSVTGSAITTPQIVQDGNTLTIKATGGTGNFTWTTTGGTITPTQGGSSATFTAPSTGSFAGTYTITATDATSGLAHQITVNVPLRMTATRNSIRENDTTQKIRIYGGGQNDNYTNVQVLNSQQQPDNNTATIGVFIKVDNSTGAFQYHEATITPKDVNALTEFYVRATSSNAQLDTVTSPLLAIIPVDNYTINTTPENATVELRWGNDFAVALGIDNKTKKAVNGQAIFTLPRQNYTFDITADNYMPATTSLTATTRTANVTLTQIATQQNYYGQIQTIGAIDNKTIQITAKSSNYKTITGKLLDNGSFEIKTDKNQFVPPVTVIVTADKATSAVQTSGGTVTNPYSFANPFAIRSVTPPAKDNQTIATSTLTSEILAQITLVDNTTEPKIAPIGEATKLEMSKMSVVKEVTIVPPVDSAYDNKTILVNSQAVKVADNTSAAFTKAKATGGEIVEIIVKYDNDTAVTSNTGIEVTIPVDRAMMKNLGSNFAVYKALDVAQFLEDNVTQLRDANPVYDEGAGKVTFKTKSFSAFGIGEAGASSQTVTSSKGGCFIATAAFGSYFDPFVKILRDFRDSVLLTNSLGQAFVDWYYRVSPPIADYIASNEALKATVRVALLPAVGFSALALHIGFVPAVAVAMLVLTALVLATRRLYRGIRA